MIAYQEKTTDELLQLLIAEEDRVTREHVQELAARPDAVEPLRAWLLDETRWRDAQHGEWWVLYHAFTILSLTRRPEVLDDLLNGLKFAHIYSFDWLTEISPAGFAQFGAAAVEPLIEFITATRDSEQWESTYWRSTMMRALTRIALEHPAVQPRVADFIISRFSDPAETDPTFLAFSSGRALTLDQERALEPLRAAFEREAVDESIAGDYDETVAWYDPEEQRQKWEYTQDLLGFYQPEQIARRQARWRNERDAEERRKAEAERRKAMAEQAPPQPAANRVEPLTAWNLKPQMSAPTGFQQTAEGNFVREEKVGRNDPCPCGSGKKYKKCCGK